MPSTKAKRSRERCIQPEEKNGHELCMWTRPGRPAVAHCRARHGHATGLGRRWCWSRSRSVLGTLMLPLYRASAAPAAVPSRPVPRPFLSVPSRPVLSRPVSSRPIPFHLVLSRFIPSREPSRPITSRPNSSHRVLHRTSDDHATRYWNAK